MDLKLENKKVFISSGDTDLGAACVVEFLNEGSQVITTISSNKKINKLFKEFKFDPSSANLAVIKKDVTLEKDRIELLPQITSTDILINHSPGPIQGNFLKWTEDDWLGSLQRNLLSNIEMIKLVIPEMQKRNAGKILNISSMSAIYPIMDFELSTVARTGLEGFVKSIAKKTDYPGISINNILPGYFLTKSLENFLNSLDENEKNKKYKELLSNIPIGRFGMPEEFAKSCCFLCSDHAGFFSGQSFLINGGQYY
jgi:3-oxoacyl-[acyl-carrier protein] reductase|tara:strand:+ start:363 stop:1127 length:765 start_codon:yes stop_codon:yes gene_type:complete